jgi:hypothetical protein
VSGVKKEGVDSTNQYPRTTSHPSSCIPLTNTNDGQPLVAHDGILANIRSRPIWTPVPQFLGQSDASWTVSRDVALAVVAAEDATHGIAGRSGSGGSGGGGGVGARY